MSLATGLTAETTGFRVPGHSDQGYKLYKAVVAAWPDPTKVVRFDVDDGLAGFRVHPLVGANSAQSHDVGSYQ